MKSFEFEMLKKEIEKLAKELKMNDKHVKRFFDGTYEGISLTKHTKAKRVVLLAKASSEATGKRSFPIIKTTKEDNHEVISKMEKFAQLIRVFRMMKKTEKAQELAVALVS